MNRLYVEHICVTLFYLLVFSLPFIGYCPLNVYGGLQASYIIAVVVLLIIVTSAMIARNKTVVVTPPCKALILWVTVAVAASLVLSLRIPQEYLDMYPQEEALFKSFKTILRLFIVISVYLVSMHMIQKPGVFKKTVRFLVYGAIFAAVYGLYQMFAYERGLPYTNIFCNNISYGGQGYSVVGWGPERVRIASTAYEPSFFANYLLLVMPMYFVLILNRQKVLKTRLRDIFGVTVMAMAFVLTFSRGGWLALAFGFFCFVARLVRKWNIRVLKKITFISFVVTAIICCIGLSGRFNVKDILVSRFAFLDKAFRGELTEGEDYSFDHRITSYGVGANIIRKHPLFGVGLGNYGFYYLDNVPEWGSDYLTRQEYADVWSNPKGIYMNVLTDTGVVGFLIFLLFLALSLKRNRRFIESSDDHYMKAAAEGLRFSFFAIMFHGIAMSFLYFSHGWFLLAAMGLRNNRPGIPENA